jgi:hypothetical protein
MGLSSPELARVVTNPAFTTFLGSMVARVEAGPNNSHSGLYPASVAKRRIAGTQIGDFVLSPLLTRVTPKLTVRARSLGSVTLPDTVLVPEFPDLTALNTAYKEGNKDLIVGIVARQPEVSGFGLTLIRACEGYVPWEPPKGKLFGATGGAASRMLRLMTQTGVRQATILYAPYTPLEDQTGNIPTPQPLLTATVGVPAVLDMLYS